MIDTCEGYTMFDLITAPNVLMLSTSDEDESAYSSELDHKLNNHLMDKFTRDFMEYLENPVMGFKNDRDFKVSDFPKRFSYSNIGSHVMLKTTGRPVDEVYLREYIPYDDITTMEQGIDDKQEGVKFYQWDDLLMMPNQS